LSEFVSPGLGAVNQGKSVLRTAPHPLPQGSGPWAEVKVMIYAVKKTEIFVKTTGCTFVRVALLTPEELEELLREEIVAASEEAAEIIRNTFGVIPKVFQGNPPVKKGDKVLLLGPNGQAVDITLVW